MNPRSFDGYLRSITAAAVTLLLIIATVYDFVRKGNAPPELITWTGIIVGVYIGAHTNQNGAASAKRATDDGQRSGGGS